MNDKDKPIVVIDIGTSSARAFVFSKFQIIGKSRFEVCVHFYRHFWIKIIYY